MEGRRNRAAGQKANISRVEVKIQPVRSLMFLRRNTGNRNTNPV
jgi:hypothetical protein